MSAPGEASAWRETGIRLAREAGAILLDALGRRHQVRYKGLVDLVTEADEASERHIVAGLRERFPDHATLAEEGGGSGATESEPRCRWIIDPLDGTTNFAHGFSHFAVSIALEVAGIVELGVVYAPALGELFIAERGEGATLNGSPIHVSTTDRLIRSLVATGFLYDPERRSRNLPHWANFVLATQGARRTGAAALDLSSVAAGRFDGFWEEGLSPWDTAAGALLVTEAGGTVTTYDGAPFSPRSPSCLASNGLIHAEMRRLLAVGGAA